MVYDIAVGGEYLKKLQLCKNV